MYFYFAKHTSSVIDIKKLSDITACSVNDLLNLTFVNVLKTFCITEELGRSRFLSGMIKEQYSFCPECLRERAYHRLIWKISNVTCCSKHSVPILDRCPHCLEIIKFGEMASFDICPQCENRLSSIQSNKVTFGIKEQIWLSEAWYSLLSSSETRIQPSEVVIRLLYILSNRPLTFDRKQVEAVLPEPIVLPTLLQQARGSLSQKRALHLSFLLSTLYEREVTLKEYLNTEVPPLFINSLHYNDGRKVDSLACIAPWCSGYGFPGTLVKTGTSVMERKTGESLFYYMVCRECGCEYALNKNGEIKERTYFIEGYRILNDASLSTSGIKELARKTGLTEDKVRRCLAYFCTRQGHQLVVKKVKVETKLLYAILSEINRGETIKEIRKWDCWRGYNHFLIYRYHQKVLHALIDIKRRRPDRHRESAARRELVNEALETLLKRDQDISLRAVSEIVGTCPETLRYCGCNSLIAQAKKEQKERKMTQKKEELYEKIDFYIDSHLEEKIRAANLYTYLGVQRTVLWRTASEINTYITERIKHHNSNECTKNSHKLKEADMLY